MYTVEANNPVRVLLLGEAEADLAVACRLLCEITSTGYEVSRERSAVAALEALRGGRHAVVILTDRVDQKSAIDFLREASVGALEVPILLITRRGDDQIDKDAVAAGACDCIHMADLTAPLMERAIRYAMRRMVMMDQMRKSRLRFGLILSSMSCAVCIRGVNGEVFYENELFRDVFGHSALMRAWDKPKEANPWLFVDGDRHWLVTSFGLFDVDGKHLKGIAAIDVTSRIRAEKMLERSVLFLNGLVNSLPVVVTMLDSTGRVLESFGRGLLDIGLDESSGITDFPLGADSSEVTREIEKAVSGQQVNFLSKVVRDGQTHYFENLFRFNEARGAGAIGFSINVTQRVQAEMARNRQGRLLQAVYRNVPVVGGRIDSSGRVVEAEGEGLRSRGVFPEMMTGRVFAELFPVARASVRKALRGGTSSFTVVGRDEQGGDWRADFAVFSDTENRGDGAIFFGRDVTERLELERKVLGSGDAERQRLGADLHDGLGQHLTGIACMVTALRDRLARTQLPESRIAADIARLVNEAIAQTRALARGLCPVQLLERNGLPAALEDLTYQAQILHSTECRFETDGTPLPLSPEATVHVYRIAQEAINNAVKHGRAARIRVGLFSERANSRLVVEDDGCGFDPDSHRVASTSGLRLMNYRTNIIGGEFKITSYPGNGTRIECSFPNENSN